jgi:exosortase
VNQKLATQLSALGGAPAVGAVDTTLKMRLLLFSGWVLFFSLLFAKPLTALLRMSFLSDDVSYLVFIPFIAAWILFADRRKLFLNLSYAPILGAGLFFCAVSVGLLANLVDRGSLDLRLSGFILALVMLWVAGFLLLFGKTASRAACFPLLFLLLMVPLPQFLLDRVIYLLQAGSAWITGAFFDLVGVPALREGFVFHLPTISIEVAQECSGIRSSMALLILALVAAHFYLRNFWSKALFVICGLFIMIVKNGIRIATLTLLAVYVDPSFLTGRLHHRGGIVFFLAGLLLMLPVLWLLQRKEPQTLGIERSSPSLL